MACEKQTFLGVTPEAFNCLVAKATANGMPISGDSGQASQGGFTLVWNYNPEAQMLDIQCLESPFMAPCLMINAKIESMVRECTGNLEP